MTINTQRVVKMSVLCMWFKSKPFQAKYHKREGEVVYLGVCIFLCLNNEAYFDIVGARADL